MAVKVDVDTCIGCGACVGVCPVGALSMNDDGKSVCDEGLGFDGDLFAAGKRAENAGSARG